MLFAQNPSYINYDTKDGLPSSEVYDVEVDEKGQVWFSTDRGLCRYDGYTFKTFTTKDGLADNTNFEIFRDSKNRMWFNGFSGRLSVYENGKFFPFAGNELLLKKIPGNWIGHFLEKNDNTLYLSVDRSNRVEILEIGIDGSVKERDDNKDGIEEEIETAIGTILSVKKNGFSFKNNPQTNTDASPLPAIRKDSIWYHYRGKTIGKSTSQKRLFQRYDFENFIGNIFLDEMNGLWVATYNGLYYFINGDLTKKPKTYFEGYHVTSSTKDKEGNFWLTSLLNGVFFIPSFEVSLLGADNKKNVNYLSIGTLKEHIVISYPFLGGIAVDSFANIKELSLTVNPNVQLSNITKHKGELNITGSKVKEVNGEVEVTIIEDENQFSIGLDNGYFMEFTGRGYWVLDRDNNEYFSSGEAKIEFQEKVMSAIQSSNGDVFLATIAGIYKVSNYEFNNPQPVLIEGKNSFGRTNDLAEDSYGNLWVATIGRGLFYQSGNNFFSVTTEDGLISDFVNRICLVNDTTIWLATNKGLSTFSYTMFSDSLHVSEVKSLTTADGLSSNFINDVDYWNNKIWLATNNGICYFSPEVVERSFPKVPVLINEFSVNDSSYDITSNLTFDFDQNNIFINFTGISFWKEEERKFYRYRLRLEDEFKPWFYTNEKNIRYNDLLPGQYTFEVAAQNKERQWSEEVTQISFKIKRHFTQTLWFNILVFLLLLMIVSFFYYTQNRRARLRETQNHQLQEARIKAREAELASLRNQMNPHFVYNSLNAIQNFIFKKESRKASRYLSKFSQLMRNSLEYTRLEYINLREEIAFLNDYLDLELMRFPNKFHTEINVAEEIDQSNLLIPSLLLQPVLENTIKHAFKEKSEREQGVLIINIFQIDKKLHIVIKDNGLGLSMPEESVKQANSTEHKPLGIEIIKNRIELLNQSDSANDAGVSFTNIVNSKGENSGLKVCFILPILYEI